MAEKNRRRDNGIVPETRLATLLDALDGIELGRHDKRIVAWLAEWDWPTVEAIASLIVRARETGGAAR